MGRAFNLQGQISEFWIQSLNPTSYPLHKQSFANSQPPFISRINTELIKLNAKVAIIEKTVNWLAEQINLFREAASQRGSVKKVFLEI